MNKNTSNLTILAYIIFIFFGAISTNWGIFIIYIPKTYGINSAMFGYILLIPAIVQAITAMLNGYYLDKINLKKQLFFAIFCISIAIILMILTNMIPILILGFIILGIALGIFAGLSNYIIVSLHPKNKFTKLNILNFFYSFGAMIGPIYAGELLNLNWDWKLVFLLNFVFIILIFTTAKITPFGKIRDENNSPSKDDALQKNWHMSIFLISAAMLFYVLSECIFSAWIVSYFKETYKFSIGIASRSLILFWFFIAIGRFGAKYFKNIKIYTFIIGSTLISLISYILILYTNNIILIYLLISLMGLGYSSLYACLLSYGIEQLSFTCPKLMSYLVISGTIGVILAFPLSSFFVNNFSIFTALISGCFILFLLLIVIVLSLFDKKNPIVMSSKVNL